MAASKALEQKPDPAQIEENRHVAVADSVTDTSGISTPFPVDLDQLTQPSVLQQAQSGDCRAIAHWLNAYLMSQGLYAQVAVDQPGRLRVMVEFTRMPQRDRLLRFICHRLCKLGSPHFSAARILGRFRGTNLSLWDQTVRLHPVLEPQSSPNKTVVAESLGKLEQWEKQVSFQVERFTKPLRNSLQLPFKPSTALSGSVPVRSATSPNHNCQPRRRPTPQLPFQQTASNSIAADDQTMAIVKVSSPDQSAVDLFSGLRWNHPVLVGSALTAFALGTGSQLLYHYPPGETMAQLEAWVNQFSGDSPEQVQTAVGPVSVRQVAIAHAPEDATATLVFGGDAWLQQSPAPSPGAAIHPAERLLPVNPYHIADAALVNLDSLDLEIDNREAIADVLADTGIDLVTLPPEPLPDFALTDPVDDSQDIPQDISQNSPQVDEQFSPGELAAALDRLELEGFNAVGAGHNQQDARRPEILDVRGQRIAYLGYSDAQINPAGRWSAGLNPVTDTHVAEDIQAIREQVDWVIVNYRWTGDLAEYPADWQVRLARYAIDQGADLVVGHHPQVLQGAEIYNGRAIAYSLGDFIFEDSEASATNTDYDTAVLKVSLNDHQMRLELLPVQVRQSQPQVVDADRGRAILTYLRHASGLFEEPWQSPQVLDVRSPSPRRDVSPLLEEEKSVDSFVDFPDATPEAPERESEGKEDPQLDSQELESPTLNSPELEDHEASSTEASDSFLEDPPTSSFTNSPEPEFEESESEESKFEESELD